MNWLITGGAGFVGQNLIKKLLTSKEKHNIRVIDNFKTSKKEKFIKNFSDFKELEIIINPLKIDNKFNIPKFEEENLQLINENISTFELINYASKDIDIIVHLAANTGVEQSILNPEIDCEINVIGTLKCLEAARKNNIQNFIFASSGAPVGDLKNLPIDEEKSCYPVSPYGASKLACEGYCSTYWKSFNVNTNVLRFSNIYGPYSEYKTSIIANFFKSINTYNKIEINGDGNQTRDFIYVDDVIEAILTCVKNDSVKGEKFQIASGKETSINKIAEKVIKLYDKEIKINYNERRQGDVLRNYSSIEKARHLLHWTPKIDLDEGLKKTFKKLNN